MPESLFQQLRLWRPDEQGAGELLSAGVGAIGLARAYGDFDLSPGSSCKAG